MINPVSSARQAHTQPTSQVTPQPARPQLKPKATEVHDKVTLKRSTGVDQDGKKL